jgi:hypothetical protein
MKRTFTLAMQPFSINRMYGRDHTHKTQAYRDWELAFVQALSKPGPQAALADIRNAFKPEEHCFIVKLKAYYPAATLFNKQGKISSRAEDLSNIEKPILDLLFLPKTHVQPAPWGCPNVNCDDKYVLRLSSGKAVSPDGKHWLQVTIAIADLPKQVVGP